MFIVHPNGRALNKPLMKFYISFYLNIFKNAFGLVEIKFNQNSDWPYTDFKKDKED